MSTFSQKLTLSNTPFFSEKKRGFQRLLFKDMKLFIALIIPILLAVTPKEVIGLEALTVVQYRVLIIFVFAALSWMLEPIPAYATSIIVIVAQLILISDGGLSFLIDDIDKEALISSKSIFSTFASPIILLFLGGFFMAIAATKYGLDKQLAGFMLKPFGSKPSTVMLGLMLITALFSMFMSNTATTAMMLAIVFPIVNTVNKKDPLRKALLLCIPLAANIGGIGTPIGTPPNAIAMKYLADITTISFGQWMMIGIPYVAVMLFLGWVLLRVLFKSETEEIKLALSESLKLTPQSIIVLVTFAGTVFLWMTKSLHGMNAYVVAVIPIALFLALGIINKDDLKGISWDVLWLVSGGIALGLALDKSGLANFAISSLPLESVSALTILIGLSFLGMVMANFMSNTAAANLMLPLIVVLAGTMTSISDVGGTLVVILSVTLSVSLGMSLPISTPPNALAFASGKLETKDLARVGVIVGIFGVFMVLLFMYVYHLFI